MVVLINDCPHCQATHAAFAGISAVKHPNRGTRHTVFFTCPACAGGLVAEVDNGAGANPVTENGNLRDLRFAGQHPYVVAKIYPKPQPTDIPAGLPARVEVAFREGCDILSKSPNAACGQFRRALELGLKDLAPEVEAWKLEKRIDKLASENKLTPAIRDWSHRLRLDGNAAVHEEEATKEFATEMGELTRFVLTYLYTLPKQVADAQANDQRGAQPN